MAPTTESVTFETKSAVGLPKSGDVGSLAAQTLVWDRYTRTAVTTPAATRTSRRRQAWDRPDRASASPRSLAAVEVRSRTIARMTISRPPTKAPPMSRLSSDWTTGWPSPGPSMRAAIVAIDRAAIVHWLSPTTIVRRAIGSWTL